MTWPRLNLKNATWVVTTLLAVLALIASLLLVSGTPAHAQDTESPHPAESVSAEEPVSPQEPAEPAAPAEPENPVASTEVAEASEAVADSLPGDLLPGDPLTDEGIARLLQLNTRAPSDRSDDLVTEVIFERTRGRGPEEPLVAFENVNIGFRWSAAPFYPDQPEKWVVAGDYITYDLPGWLVQPQTSVPMNNDAGRKVADCVQEARKLTCTFTDWAENNPRNLSGYYIARASVVQSQDPAVVSQELHVGQHSVKVPEANNGEINHYPAGPPEHKLPNQRTFKYGAWFGSQNLDTGMAYQQWRINLYDDTAESFEIVDTMPAGMTRSELTQHFANEGSVIVRKIPANVEGSWDQNTSPHTVLLRPGDPSYPEVTWTTNDEGREVAEIRIKNEPTAEGVHYVFDIRIYTQVPIVGLEVGQQFTNSVTINGETLNEATMTAMLVIDAGATGDPARGTVNVGKKVNVAEGMDVPAGTYTVNAKFSVPANSDYQFAEQDSCTATETPASGTRDFVVDCQIADGETFSLQLLPAKTVVELTEVRPSDTPDLQWALPRFGGGVDGEGEFENVEISADGASAKVTVSGGQTRNMLVTNSAVALLPLEASKSVVGLPAGVAAGLEFTVNYTCAPGENVLPQFADADPISGSLILPGSGESVSAEGVRVPVGFDCTFTEVEPGAVDGYTFGGTAVENTSDATVYSAKVTNTYASIPTLPVQASKSVVGLPAGVAAGLEFTVNYTCAPGENVLPQFADADPISGSLILPGSGESVSAEGVRVPVGFDCTFTEVEPGAVDGYTFGGTAVENTSDATVYSAKVTNTYASIPTLPVQASKSVVGLPAGVAAGLEFTVNYTCAPGENVLPQFADADPISGSLILPGSGESVSAEGVRVPVGFDCTFTEVEPGAVDGYTFGGTAVENTSDATVYSAKVTNTYEEIPPTPVPGPSGSSIDLPWWLLIPAVLLPIIGIGSSSSSAPAEVAPVPAPAPTPSVVVEAPPSTDKTAPSKGAPTTSQTQQAPQKTAPTATPTPARQPGLANTGANTITLTGIALALMIAGAAVLIIRRRS